MSWKLKVQRFFASQIPNEWICRKIDQDYAIDMEVEIASDEVSGKSFLVQLKSSEFFSPREGFTNYSFETDKLQYFLRKDTPVVLVLTDLKSEQCYWIFTQEYVFEQLDNENPNWKQQKTATIKVPVQNTLSESLGALREMRAGIFLR